MKEPSSAASNSAASVAARRKRKLKRQSLKWKRVQEAAAVSKSLLEPLPQRNNVASRTMPSDRPSVLRRKRGRGTDTKVKLRGRKNDGKNMRKRSEAQKGKRNAKTRARSKSKITDKLSNNLLASPPRSNRKRLLVVGSHKLLGMRYADRSKGFCQLIERFLTTVGKKELSKAQKPIKFKLLWHDAKVETLTYPCQYLRDALGEHAQGGSGQLGLQLQAAINQGWPYSHVLVVDDFLPGDGCPSIAAVRETVQEIISASVQFQVRSVVLCVLPNAGSVTQEFKSNRMPIGNHSDRKDEKGEEGIQDPQSPSSRPRLESLMGLTLHSNDFSGFNDTTEILVHNCTIPTQLEGRTPLQRSTASTSPPTPGLSSAMLPDVHMMAIEEERWNTDKDKHQKAERLVETLSTPPSHLGSGKRQNALPAERAQFRHRTDKHENIAANKIRQDLSTKRKRAIATALGTFLIDQTEAARQAFLRLQILAHNAQRERLREMRKARVDSALQKIAQEQEIAREIETESRVSAKAQAEAAGLPAKLARQKRIAWEAWLAGELKREKSECRNMALAEDECRTVWDEMLAIAQRRERARQRDLTQARKRKRKVDKAIIAVLTFARKMYLKQQAKLDPADAELRAIQAAQMKKMGRKQKELLNGWTTRKRLLAEAFAKLPFVCTPVTFFERAELLLHLGHIERSYAEPKLDTSFGPLVSATQGSPKMTYTGADFSHKLKIGAPFSVKGEEFKVIAIRANEVELDNQFSGTTGKYKALYLEEGPVERFRLVPEEERPLPLSVLFKAVSNDGRVW